jgi:hypothetical protein
MCQTRTVHRRANSVPVLVPVHCGVSVVRYCRATAELPLTTRRLLTAGKCTVIMTGIDHCTSRREICQNVSKQMTPTALPGLALNFFTGEEGRFHVT